MRLLHQNRTAGRSFTRTDLCGARMHLLLPSGRPPGHAPSTTFLHKSFRRTCSSLLRPNQKRRGELQCSAATNEPTSALMIAITSITLEEEEGGRVKRILSFSLNKTQPTIKLFIYVSYRNHNPPPQKAVYIRK